MHLGSISGPSRVSEPLASCARFASMAAAQHNALWSLTVTIRRQVGTVCLRGRTETVGLSPGRSSYLALHYSQSGLQRLEQDGCQRMAGIGLQVALKERLHGTGKR